MLTIATVSALVCVFEVIPSKRAESLASEALVLIADEDFSGASALFAYDITEDPVSYREQLAVSLATSEAASLLVSNSMSCQVEGAMRIPSRLGGGYWVIARFFESSSDVGIVRAMHVVKSHSGWVIVPEGVFSQPSSSYAVAISP